MCQNLGVSNLQNYCYHESSSPSRPRSYRPAHVILRRRIRWRDQRSGRTQRSPTLPDCRGWLRRPVGRAAIRPTPVRSTASTEAGGIPAAGPAPAQPLLSGRGNDGSDAVPPRNLELVTVQPGKRVGKVKNPRPDLHDLAPGVFFLLHNSNLYL